MKWLRVVGIIAAVLFVLVVVAAITLPYVLSARVNSEIVAIKAKGEPVSSAELAGPKIPDNENAALIYLQAFKPISNSEADNDLYTAKGFISREKLEKDPKLWQKARPIVDRYRGALVLAEKASTHPKCRFPAKWKDWNAELPHYHKLRNLVRLISINSLLEARAGKIDEAMRSVELGFKVGESIKDDPLIISQLVRFACLSMTSRSLQEFLRYNDLNESQAKRLFTVLDGIDLSDSITEALRGERAMGISFFNIERYNPLAIDETAGDSNNAEKKANKKYFRPSILWITWTYADEAYYLKTMHNMVENSKSSYRIIQERHLDTGNMTDIPRYALMSTILLPVFSRASSKRDREIAEIRGDQIMLALQAYKDRYGSYPRDLTELRAKLGWTLKADPFSGKDFIYKKQDRGFILYSIGENLKDDGAKTVPYPTKPLGPNREKILSRHPYRTPDGRRSADKIWTMDH